MAELNDSLDQVPFKFSAYSLDQNVDRKKKYASKVHIQLHNTPSFLCIKPKQSLHLNF